MSRSNPIDVVPGNDWSFYIVTLNSDGTEANMSDWTVVSAVVTGGLDPFDVDVTPTDGSLLVEAEAALTSGVRMGIQSILTIVLLSPTGLQTTVVSDWLNGVTTLMSQEGSIRIIGTPGKSTYDLYVAKYIADGGTPGTQLSLDDWLDAQEESRLAAEDAADRAEAARDSTWTDAEFFATTALGLDGTTVGQKFRVATDDGYGWQLYSHDAGPVATPIGDPMPNKSAYDALASDLPIGNTGAPIVESIGAGLEGYFELSGRKRLKKPLAAEDVDAFGYDSALDGHEIRDSTEQYVLGRFTDDGDLIVPRAIHVLSGQVLGPDGLQIDGAPVTDRDYAPANAFLSPDRMHSAWIKPVIVETAMGDIYGGGMSNVLPDGNPWGGPIWAHQRIQGGAEERKFLIRFDQAGEPHTEEFRVDDHAVPCVFIKTHPTATYKIEVFQADHANNKFVRYWRSTTWDLADLAYVGTIAVDPAEDFGATYGQAHVLPTDPGVLHHWWRQGSTETPHWGCFERANEADATSAWTKHFDVFDGQGQYMLSEDTLDGTGYLIGFYGHGESAVDFTIRLARFYWADNSLKGMDGTVISSDLFAEAGPIDPTASAGWTVIRAHPAANTYFRLNDIIDLGSEVRVLWQEFQGLDPDTDSDGYTMAASVDPVTGVVTVEDPVCLSGGKVQSTENTYTANGCFDDLGNAWVSRWFPATRIGELVYVEKGGSEETAVLIDRVYNGKIIRPEPHYVKYWDATAGREVTKRAPRITYLRGKGVNFGYRTFRRWQMDGYTLDRRHYTSVWS